MNRGNSSSYRAVTLQLELAQAYGIHREPVWAIIGGTRRPAIPFASKRPNG